MEKQAGAFSARLFLVQRKEVMKMEQLLGYAANFGFPALMCTYLLIRIEGKLEQLSASIQELAKVIARK